MKRIISFCLLLLSIILVPTKIIGQNLEKSYTNNEGVLISSSVKENLEIMDLEDLKIGYLMTMTSLKKTKN